MIAYLVRRVLVMIPTLIGITFLVFMLVALSPGGVGAALEMASGASGEASNRALQEAYLEDRYGLNDPVILQYLRWLGRVSPIKFGTRDQVSPTGELIRSPRTLREPPLWQWFADELPTVPRESFEFEPDSTIEERASIYQAASFAYSRQRAAFVARRTELIEALDGYAQATNQPHAVQGTGTSRIQYDILERAGKQTDAPNWPEVEAAGKAVIAAYASALKERAMLAAIFRAKPFPEAGYPVIPGLMSVAAPDMGVSFARSRPVIELIRHALPVTLLLNLIAFPIIYMIAIPSGMLAALRRGQWQDVTLGMAFVALWAIPIVWAGVLCVGFLANNEYLGWFPVTGLHSSDASRFLFLPSWGEDGLQRGYLLDTLWHITLPVLCLVYGGFAILSKQTRAAMLDNLNADYVRTAKAKGVPRKDVIFRHVFRNSLLPLITIFVTIFPAMLSGSVVIEKIFSIPGMGNLIIEAIYLRDREIILAVTLFAAAINLIALLIADVLYALADPRISYR